MTIVDQLKRDEGLRLKPYRDSVGKLTIGYGRNLDDEGISQQEAEMLLSDDVQAVGNQLHGLLPWTDGLDEARRGVLLNMAFNMGIYGLMQFKNTLGLIQQGDYLGAAVAMRQSKWAEQVGPRAERLAIQMETGQWQ